MIPILISNYIVNKDASRRLNFLDSMYRDGEYILREFISSYFYNILFIAYIKLVVDIQQKLISNYSKNHLQKKVKLSLHYRYFIKTLIFKITNIKSFS